jgi:DNA-binding response OmpR family regulator
MHQNPFRRAVVAGASMAGLLAARALSVHFDQVTIVERDEQAATREMVGDYLAIHGYSVTLCDGGEALRAAVAETLPALVVLDLHMPGEDGLSLVRFLRQRGHVPIIMLTATASAIDRVGGPRARCRRLCRKAL